MWAVILTGCGALALPGRVVPAPDDVHGFPGSRTNAAGVYSWNMEADAGMHHHVGVTSDVQMLFSPAAAGPRSGVPFSVAGYAGTAEESVRDEDGHAVWVWNGLMETTPVTITLEAMSKDAGLGAGFAVIDTMRLASRQIGHEGLILIFTLPDGWDSG